MRTVLSSLALAALLVAPRIAAAQATVTVAPAEATAPVPPRFLGLSFETSAILPQPDGRYPFFTADNAGLAKLFHNLGVGNLRIGGNTADTPTVPIPAEKDIDNLFAFARRADVRVLYTLRMRDGDPAPATGAAAYVWGRYGARIDCLAIGNEPDVFEHHDFAAYTADMNRFLPAVEQAAPGAPLCGPGTTGGDPAWAAKYTDAFGRTPHLAYVTQHLYPGGNGKKIASIEAGRAQLLSPDIDDKYARYAEAFLPGIKAAGLKFRLEETNNFHHAGAEGVSNTFTATLWGLGYLNWWLNHGADGVNFHTGVTTAAGDALSTCWYAVFWQQDGRPVIQPLAYALKAFSLTAHGRVLPVHLTGAAASLQAFATLDDGGAVWLTLINRAHGPDAAAMPVTIGLPQGYARAQALDLRAEDDDIGATSGIRLGGAAIDADGGWDGRWRPLRTGPGQLIVKVPQASAMIVKMTR